MEKENRIQVLHKRFLDNTLDQKDSAEFLRLLQDQTLLENLVVSMQKDWDQMEDSGSLSAENRLRIAETIVTRFPNNAEEDNPSETKIPVLPTRPVHFLRTAWFRIAVSFLLFAGIGTYFWLSSPKAKVDTTQAKALPEKYDVAPGSNRAVLTLSDGRKVELTQETKSIAEAGVAIQNAEGTLKYGTAEKVVFNTMTTPRGGQYQLSLADGTRVWLNAASSITFPTVFKGDTREVSITGEAYFEVAQNKSSPFRVKTPEEDILVLGTSFNVNAYSDEKSIKTSLLEGSVKVGTKVLRPGQAFVNGTIMPTNISKDIAWKNGVFDFQDAGIDEIMRQFARWYNIEVIYEKGIPDIQFIGKMGRDLSLSSALNLLKKTKVNFRLEQNNKLVILP